MEAYLDNSATTPCDQSVCDIMVKVMMEDYGNPSSLHLKGVQAEKYIKEAKEKIAKTLKVTDKEIVFTSGGTESNNFAIIGSAMANRRAGKHLITTAIEHASVAAPVKFLEEQGFEVTYLSVDREGRISLDELEASVREDTILVSLMQVNNEIGAVEPIEEAAALIKRKNPKTLLHIDAIQSYGKMRLYPKKLQVDMLSVSGHKLHGPKGIGFLYIKDKTKIKPILFGGGQQKGQRSGTENVPAIAGLGVACEEICRDIERNREKLYEVKQAFLQGLERLEGVHVNGRTGEDSAPHIVSVSFEEIAKSEALLHALEERGIYVSAGSACSSNKPAVSATLKAIGIPREWQMATLRFSFSVHTTVEEVDYAVTVLEELLPFLRKYKAH
ncbi:MAG: cysteine desulfurase [Lachnospiraceae bacterium]|nr:cysteine desulfurase [Lachnospiraceae bacterium]